MGATTLTPFQLTGVTFTPTYFVQYELKLGQLWTAAHQARAGENLKEGKQLYRNAQRQKLRIAYAKFEQLRAKFLEAVAAKSAAARAAQAKADSEVKAAEARAAEKRPCDADKEGCAQVKASAAKACTEMACDAVKVAVDKVCGADAACTLARQAEARANGETKTADRRAAQAKADNVASAFHEMKVQAIEVLSMVNHQGVVLEYWLEARISEGDAHN
jgi:hypothetical protein